MLARHELEILRRIAEAAERIERLLAEMVLDDGRTPATIRLTDRKGVPVSSVSLTGTQSVVVAIAVADASGTPIPGAVLEPGATVTVGDSAICTAVLDSTETSVTVTALDVTGATTVTVDGTSGGVALTDFGGPLEVTTTAAAPTPATIVLTPGTPA